MFTLYIVLIVFFCILLILLTLLQNSKKDNSSGNIIGSMGANKIIGIRETTSILTKMTMFCIFFIFFMSTLFNKTLKNTDNIKSSPNLDMVKKYSKQNTEENDENKIKDENKKENDENKVKDEKDNKQI
jgi:protein translocase SecG subunit